jgi:predicted RNA-binding Zn-ribbon protein involved in translation (DUF1610 family)
MNHHEDGLGCGDDDDDGDDDLNDTDIDCKGYEIMEDGTQIMSSLLLQFKCKVCSKGFKHRRSLNRHVKLHSGEKNFICPYCTTAFARSDHLKAHIRTHNNSKPYRCPICQCGYSTQAALKVHMAHHHSKSKFKCALCNNLEFHSQLALEGHIYTKHSKENNDLNELINETRGRYSQPTKLEFNKMNSNNINDSSMSLSNGHGNSNYVLDNHSNNPSQTILDNQHNNNNNSSLNTDESNSIYSNYNRSRLIDINNIKGNGESNTNYNGNKDNALNNNNSSHPKIEQQHHSSQIKQLNEIKKRNNSCRCLRR